MDHASHGFVTAVSKTFSLTCDHSHSWQSRVSGISFGVEVLDSGFLATAPSLLIQLMADDSYVQVFFCFLSIKDGKLEWRGAPYGHPPLVATENKRARFSVNPDMARQSSSIST